MTLLALLCTTFRSEFNFTPIAPFSLEMCQSLLCHMISFSFHLIHFRFYVMRSSRKAAKQRATGLFQLDYFLVLSRSPPFMCQSCFTCTSFIYTVHTMESGAKQWLALVQKMTILWPSLRTTMESGTINSAMTSWWVRVHFEKNKTKKKPIVFWPILETSL